MAGRLIAFTSSASSFIVGCMFSWLPLSSWSRTGLESMSSMCRRSFCKGLHSVLGVLVFGIVVFSTKLFKGKYLLSTFFLLVQEMISQAKCFVLSYYVCILFPIGQICCKICTNCLQFYRSVQFCVILTLVASYTFKLVKSCTRLQSLIKDISVSSSSTQKLQSELPAFLCFHIINSQFRQFALHNHLQV